MGALRLRGVGFRMKRADLRRYYYRAIKVLPARKRVQLDYLRRHGKILHLSDPKTFSEKICWRKLYDRDPRFVIWADKVAVKEVVAERIGVEHVVPTLWQGFDIREAPFDTLEPPFVVKAANGSGANAFVHTREEFDRTAIERQFKNVATTHVGLDTDEWFYDHIPPRVLIEPMLITEQGMTPTDYKFHMFHGELEAIQVDVDRFTNHRRAFYSLDWKKLDIALLYPLAEDLFPKPVLLEEMYEIAKELSAEFDYVRVDLYECKGRVYFGEMTFTHGAGYEQFEPVSVDLAWGSKWRLDRSVA